MLFKVIVCADDGGEVDYSIDLLRSDDAQSFIRGWQALQDATRQPVTLAVGRQKNESLDSV
jgi:hypothetical protein